MISNFDFLKNEYPELYNLGLLAEELIDTDAASCISKLRTITEFIAKDIYYKNFNIKSQHTQLDLLKELKPYIQPKYMDVFHIIRKQGNTAVHENSATYEQALTLLKFTYGVCVWHFIVNCSGDEDLIKPFSKPVSRMLLLEKELEEIRNKNNELLKEIENKEQNLQEKQLSEAEANKKIQELLEKQNEKEETIFKYSDLSEAQTRHYIIDNLLLDAGLNLKKVENFN